MTPRAARRAPGTTRQGIRDLNHTPAPELASAVDLERLPPIRIGLHRAGTDPHEVVASIPFDGPSVVGRAYYLAAAVVRWMYEAQLSLEVLPVVKVCKLGGRPVAVEVRVSSTEGLTLLRCVEEAARETSFLEGHPTHRVEVLR